MRRRVGLEVVEVGGQLHRADAVGDDDALNRRSGDARYGAYAVQWYKLSGTTASATRISTRVKPALDWRAEVR